MRRKRAGWLKDELHAESKNSRFQCREKFLMNLEEIRQALLDGCSIKAIWKKLNDNNLYPGSYSGFQKLTRKFFPLGFSVNAQIPTTQAVSPQQAERAPARRQTSRPPAPQGRAPIREPIFNFNNKPINSDGEPIT